MSKVGYENWSPEHLYMLRENKINYGKTNNQAFKDVYNLNNKNIRASYGMADADDISVNQLDQYIALAEQNQQKNKLLTNLTNNTGVNPNVKKSADAIQNFAYNPNRDPAYQSYVDMYNRQGQSAAKQTLNNLNSANMGRNSSYSSAATAQVQQAYAKQASEMIPTLAQQAYERLVNNYSIARDMDDTQYNRALTGYQALADDYTRGLTDKQLELNNQMSEIDLKYYEPNAQIAHDMNKLNYDMGLLEYGDAKFNSDLNRNMQNNKYLQGCTVEVVPEGVHPEAVLHQVLI